MELLVAYLLIWNEYHNPNKKTMLREAMREKMDNSLNACTHSISGDMERVRDCQQFYLF
jgi:hypothetical protein